MQVLRSRINQIYCNNSFRQEAQLSQRDRAAACLNYGKNISAKSVHLGYSSGNSVEHLGSLIMSMPASVTWHVRNVLHTVRIGHFYPS